MENLYSLNLPLDPLFVVANPPSRKTVLPSMVYPNHRPVFLVLYFVAFAFFFSFVFFGPPFALFLAAFFLTILGVG